MIQIQERCDICDGRGASSECWKCNPKPTTGVQYWRPKNMEEQVKPTFKQKFKHWWLTLTKEEWELTIFFPGETRILADGSRIESSSPKVYQVSKVIKLTNKHIVFKDTNNIRHEIVLVNPVGYDLKKIY